MNTSITLESIRELLQQMAANVSQIAGDGLFEMPPKVPTVAERERQLEAGQYLLAPHAVIFRAATTELWLNSLLDVMQEYLPDRRPQMAPFREFMSGHPEDRREFFAKSLANDTRYLMDLARRLGQEPDVILFLSIYLLRPHRCHLASVLLDQIDRKDWWRGYCPVCGHWPGLAFLFAENGRRDLWCAACTTTWRFKRIQCPFCLNENQAQLHYLSVEEEEMPSQRLYLCDNCRRYLKCVAVNDGATSDTREKDVAYLAGAYLDYLATEKGYIQEPVTSVRYEPDTVKHYHSQS